MLERLGFTPGVVTLPWKVYFLFSMANSLPFVIGKRAPMVTGSEILSVVSVIMPTRSELHEYPALASWSNVAFEIERNCFLSIQLLYPSMAELIYTQFLCSSSTSKCSPNKSWVTISLLSEGSLRQGTTLRLQKPNKFILLH